MDTSNFSLLENENPILLCDIVTMIQVQNDKFNQEIVASYHGETKEHIERVVREIITMFPISIYTMKPGEFFLSIGMKRIPFIYLALKKFYGSFRRLGTNDLLESYRQLKDITIFTNKEGYHFYTWDHENFKQIITFMYSEDIYRNIVIEKESGRRYYVLNMS